MTVSGLTLTDSEFTLDGAVATLRFMRHDARNGLTSTQIVEDIVATVDWINARDDVAVLILTGDGSTFSGGGNVKDMVDRSGAFEGTVEELQNKYRRGIQQMPLAMQKLEVPCIAAVNGPAIGAGFDLANMCDIRIASEKAKFGETFINLGIIPGDGGAWFLQRLIGYQRAAELTFSGRIIDAYEAKDLGIVLDVVKPEKLLDHVKQLAADIAGKPTHSVRMTKRLMKMAQRQELPDFLDMCAALQGMAHHNPDHVKAVEDFYAALTKGK